MAGETILIVEDDPTLLRGLKDNFEFAGYVVKVATDGEQGLNAALKTRPDLILLDLMLPGLNGYEVCRSVRDAELDMPIIMLTAKNQESDIVLGLNLGANDYVTKPFSIRELLARAKAFLRPRAAEAQATYRFGDCELDLRSRRLSRKGHEVPLTPKEFGLLALMVKETGRAFTREQLLNAVWGHDIVVTQRSVDRCVNALRNAIEVRPSHPVLLRTVWGIGYRFDARHA
ncbi:MAG: response regulator transcription factor [Kiritimatiellae bacterium]|nr:response regulator transcription factor [Kiritimatiellia bacterium]